MSKITSIATGLPEYLHKQQDLFEFADAIYSKDETDSRKLRFLYRQSGIEKRYSVIPDFTNGKRVFFPPSKDLEPFPGIDQRMQWYNRHAAQLSVKTVLDCIKGKILPEAITHLVTVSCTGMSAPGLDLQVMEALGLPGNITRTSVNFMGCYAAVHALKIADAFCKTPGANVVIVCTELCTIHFQNEPTPDNITSTLLFSDGCAAALVQGDQEKGIRLDNFFSDVSFKGKLDMAWEISSKGFLMTLSGYVPDMIREDFGGLVDKALQAGAINKSDITHWCIHPGGKKILEAITASLSLEGSALNHSYDVLREYGNMSSATILFVLKRILDEESQSTKQARIFGAAFGPGLTMETFIATHA